MPMIGKKHTVEEIDNFFMGVVEKPAWNFERVKKSQSTFLKVAAILLMFSDHIGAYLFPEYPIFRIIGRLGLPIWPFFLAMGYHYTHDKKTYLVRLLVCAVVAQLPYYLLGEPGLNAVFAFAVGLCILAVNEKLKIWQKIIFTAAAGAIAAAAGVQWIFLIPTVGYYYLRKSPKDVLIFSIILYSASSMVHSPYNILGLAGLILIRYPISINLKLSKLLLYSVYPVHLMILYFLTFIK